MVADDYGPPETLRVVDLPVPEPGAGEVLVRVRAAGMDRGTWHLVAGLPLAVRPVFGLRRPRQPVPGLDVAGVVEAVGADVDDFEPGDEVFGIARGSFAELAVAEADKLAPKPTGLSFEQAAAVPVSAITALHALVDEGGLEPGASVLILGASGGVGSYAVQLAHSMGADVTGVCSAAKVDLVRSLGADHVVDYTTHDPVDGSRRYDLVVDIGGNRKLRHLRRALTEDGTLVIVGGESGGRLLGGADRQVRGAIWSVFIRQTIRMFVAPESADDLERLRPYLEDGSVAPAVDEVVDLDGVRAALTRLAAGEVRGKVVVSPTGGAGPAS